MNSGVLRDCLLKSEKISYVPTCCVCKEELFIQASKNCLSASCTLLPLKIIEFLLFSLSLGL